MDAAIIDVLGEISRKSLGIVGVSDSDGTLLGVITDGDIRRYLEANSEGSMKDTMWDTHASALMTPGSVFLEPERLNARALHVLKLLYFPLNDVRNQNTRYLKVNN